MRRDETSRIAGMKIRWLKSPTVINFRTTDRISRLLSYLCSNEYNPYLGSAR